MGTDVTSKVDAEDIDPQNYKCGSGFFKYYPNYLQWFANSKKFLVFFTLIGVCEGMMFTYVLGVLTSVERHFQMSSQQSGLLLTLGEVVPVVLNVFVSFYGSRGNRPRWMAAGLFLITLYCVIIFTGYLIIPIPNFSTTSLVETEESSEENHGNLESLCLLSQDSIHSQMQYNSSSKVQKICTIDHGSSGISFAILLMAFSVLDVGPSMLYTIGLPYMDDGTSKKEFPLYLSVTTIMRMAGPLMGRFLSSACLHLYVYPHLDPGISENDPRWIGAWWLGFVVMAITFFSYGLLMGLFPFRLKKKVTTTKEVELKEDIDEECPKVSPSEENGIRLPESENPNNVDPQSKNWLDALQVRELWAAILRLLKNPVWVCSTFSAIFDATAANGFDTWLSKFLEHQFHISKSDSSLHSALGSNVTIFIGVLLSGYVMYKFRLSARVIIAITAVSTLVYGIGTIGLMYITCDQSDIMPGTLLPDGSLELFDPRCSKECSCGTEVFAPVCLEGPNVTSPKTFFSACHAGCHGTLRDNTSHIYGYTNCTCLDDDHITLRTGYCAEACTDKLLVYDISLATLNLFIATTLIGHIIIDIRYEMSLKS